MNQQIIEIIKPNPQVIVYGSGLSGLSTALRLARENIHPVILQTPDDELSPGYLNNLLDNPAMIAQFREEMQKDKDITWMPIASLKQGISNPPLTTDTGFRFTTNNGHNHTQEYGTIIFAPERVEQPPDVAGTLNLTQLYSKLFAQEKIRGTVVFLLDHQQEVQSEVFKDVLHAALYLQKQANTEVWLLAKQIQVALQGQEELYDQCRETGVIFIKYRDDCVIKEDNGQFLLLGFDTQVESEFTISGPDILVSPQKTVLPPSALAFADALNIRILNDQYTQPDSLWRLPNETNRPGIFAVGAARGNMDKQAIIDDAASVVLSVKERLKPEGIPVKEHIPIVDKGKCVYCLTCVRTCPFGAMQKGKGQGMAASVTLLACQACGTCVAVCPAGALNLRNENESKI